MLLHRSEPPFLILHRTVSPWKTNLIGILFYFILGWVLAALWIHWGKAPYEVTYSFLLPAFSFLLCRGKVIILVPIFSKGLGNESGQLADVGCIWPSGVAMRGSVPLNRGRCCWEQGCFYSCMTGSALRQQESPTPSTVPPRGDQGTAP